MAPGGVRCGKPPRERSTDGAKGDVNAAMGEGVVDAFFSESRLLDRCVIRQHAHHHFAIGGCCGGICYPSPSRCKRFGFAPGPVMHCQIMPRLKQIARYRQPHVSQSDETDLHSNLLHSAGVLRTSTRKVRAAAANCPPAYSLLLS